MKAAGPELIFILQSRSFYQADLYTISGGNLGGTALRYCSGDMDIRFNGNLYPCGGTVGPYWDRQDERARIHLKAGMEVDTITIDLLPGSAQIFGVPFLVALKNQLFDGAEFRIDRVYMPVGSYGDTRAGSLVHFVGRIGAIDFGRNSCTLQVNSHLELLDLPLPRNQYQPGCVFSLYDTGCGVNPLSYQFTGTVAVTPVSTNSTIYATISGSFITGAFDLGKITMTSGALNGLPGTIKVCVFGTPNVIQIVGFYPNAPAPGDTFSINYGCDKTTGTNGCLKFNNLARFRGFPYIPQPSTAV